MTAAKRQDRYGRWIPATLQARDIELQALPVIDFAPMLEGDPEGKRRAAAALRHACTDVGFFDLQNHGVPQALIDRTFVRARDFFALPFAEKMAIEITRTPGYGGYSPTLEATGGTKGRRLQEGFNMNLELPPDDPYVLADRPFYNRNSWPAGQPEFRAGMLEYFAAMQGLGRRLCGAFALGLDLDEGFFEPMIGKPITLMRVNHYSPQPDAVDDTDIGGRPHTDYECFTILAQEGGITALQIVGAHGEWISVPPLPGTFVINIADQMARWTNDRFASTMHRVVNKNDRDRLSIAFFFGTDDDVEVAALPGSVPAGEAPKYPPIRAGDYILGRIDNAYNNDLAKRMPAPPEAPGKAEA